MLNTKSLQKSLRKNKLKRVIKNKIIGNVKLLRKFINILAILMGTIGILRYFISPFPRHPMWDAFYTNVHAELIGIGITVIAFSTLSQFADEQSEKKRLILQMGSPNNIIAIEATRQLRELGWLQDGTLWGANLMQANLKGVNLNPANLEYVNLFGANLKGAKISNTNLEGALLVFASLNASTLKGVNLKSSFLYHVNFSDSSLEDVNFEGAIYDDSTKWPNGFNTDTAGLVKIDFSEINEELEKRLNKLPNK